MSFYLHITRDILFTHSHHFILFNPTEETMSYHLFAFVNNTPVMWDSSPYSSITLPAKSQFSSSILLSDSQMQNISDDSPDLFFLVAVPIHEAAQQQGTLVLKTKTIAFVTWAAIVHTIIFQIFSQIWVMRRKFFSSYIWYVYKGRILFCLPPDR